MLWIARKPCPCDSHRYDGEHDKSPAQRGTKLPLPPCRRTLRETENLTESKCREQKAALREPEQLARYLARIRNKFAIDGAEPDLLFSSLVALEQFDSALWALNPDVTVGEALERVRAYRVWLGYIQNGIHRAHDSDRKVEDLERYFARVVRGLDRRYRPLFARAA